jgi:hypothetical protein
VETGVQRIYNYLKKLDSGFRRNDRKPHFQTSYEFIKFWGAKFFAEGKELPTGHEENGRESRLVDS